MVDEHEVIMEIMLGSLAAITFYGFILIIISHN
ncbi:hypothetical protein phiPccP1_00020 [Pectobacterium phage phiPccP-1]|nr:hypothetical protein phiPccP1_00020 [Pectobacterium phage phiPccP-1]